jgi:hypothetical protein
VISADGRFAYALVRFTGSDNGPPAEEGAEPDRSGWATFNKIAILSLDAETGAATLVDSVSSGANMPWTCQLFDNDSRLVSALIDCWVLSIPSLLAARLPLPAGSPPAYLRSAPSQKLRLVLIHSVPACCFVVRLGCTLVRSLRPGLYTSYTNHPHGQSPHHHHFISSTDRAESAHQALR